MTALDDEMQFIHTNIKRLWIISALQFVFIAVGFLVIGLRIT